MGWKLGKIEQEMMGISKPMWISSGVLSGKNRRIDRRAASMVQIIDMEKNYSC